VGNERLGMSLEIKKNEKMNGTETNIHLYSRKFIHRLLPILLAERRNAWNGGVYSLCFGFRGGCLFSLAEWLDRPADLS
jgi:hypothetical protein